MPFYDYHCADCGEFTLNRLIAQRDNANCPGCGAGARRGVCAPALSLMPAQRRSAFARNEKSRHEPGVQQRHRCNSRCGCGPASVNLSGKGKRTVEIPKLGQFQKGRKSQRPWMLGH